MFFLPFPLLLCIFVQAIEYIIPSVELRVRDPGTGLLLSDHAAMRYPILSYSILFYSIDSVTVAVSVSVIIDYYCYFYCYY